MNFQREVVNNSYSHPLVELTAEPFLVLAVLSQEQRGVMRGQLHPSGYGDNSSSASPLISKIEHGLHDDMIFKAPFLLELGM